MQNPQSRAGSARVKRLLYFFAVLAVLLVLYQGTMWGIRQYTTGLIDDVAGRELPDFSLTDLDGQPVSKDSMRGKTIVLNFFRSKCHNCQEEHEDIVRFARELDPAKVALIGIMVDRVQGFPPEVTAKTLAEFGYEHPILMADDAFVDAFHGAGWSQITPVTYIADAKGVIVRCFRYPYSVDDLRAALP